MPQTQVIKVAAPAEVAPAAAEAARVVRAGGLVGFATETVYGIAALAGNHRTMERLRDLKSRPSRPFSVHIGRRVDVRRYIGHIPPQAAVLIDKAWPGPVSILMKLGGQLADATLQAQGLYDILASDDTIGLRCPDEPVAIAMLSAVKDVVVAPSANLAGQPSPRTGQDVLDSLDGKIDLLVDSGPTRYGKDSTIVSFATPKAGQAWQVIREGVLDERAIRRLTRRRVLFVCTGNTCRSPMAAGIARKLLADKYNCSIGELKDCGVEVASAGLFAGEGVRASPEAALAAREHGADISRHRSRMLTRDLIRWADMVFCMTDFHVQQARRLAPQDADKIRRLDERADVSDPIGGGGGIYRKVAQRIERVLRNLLDEGTL